MQFWGTLVDVLAATHSLFHHDMLFGYERPPPNAAVRDAQTNPRSSASSMDILAS
jgi:hypothetical protein